MQLANRSWSGAGVSSHKAQASHRNNVSSLINNAPRALRLLLRLNGSPLTAPRHVLMELTCFAV